MWDRQPQSDAESEPSAGSLREALRKARIDSAERTGVVVDLHDAEVARLELLNDALDSLFVQIPSDVDLFERGLSRGPTPRLWVDPVAHIHMGRDKRTYRFVHDTRYGRRVLAEGLEIPAIVDAVTTYVAQRMIERERALSGTGVATEGASATGVFDRRHRRLTIGAFVLGLASGVIALIVAALLSSPMP